MDMLYWSAIIQSNPLNIWTVTKGDIDSVHINRMSVLSGSCFYSQKYTFYFDQNTTEIKQDTSIVKLNISNFTKPLFRGLFHERK